MTTFLHDDLLDPSGYWCPDCGEPRPLCCCDERDIMADEFDELYGAEMHECPQCNGTGGNKWDDGITPCPHCDGEGYEWWLP